MRPVLRAGEPAEMKPYHSCSVDRQVDDGRSGIAPKRRGVVGENPAPRVSSEGTRGHSYLAWCKLLDAELPLEYRRHHFARLVTGERRSLAVVRLRPCREAHEVQLATLSDGAGIGLELYGGRQARAGI